MPVYSQTRVDYTRWELHILRGKGRNKRKYFSNGSRIRYYRDYRVSGKRVCVSRWGDTSKVEYVRNWSGSGDNIAAEHCYVIIAL